MSRPHPFRALALAALAFSGQATASPLPPAPSPETVLATYRVAPGKEAEFIRVLRSEQQWLRGKGYVVADPARHLLLRSVGDTGEPTCIVELFTWTDSYIPDHAPKELQAYWDEMNRLCPRVGRTPGIAFVEVEPVP